MTKHRPSPSSPPPSPPSHTQDSQQEKAHEPQHADAPPIPHLNEQEARALVERNYTLSLLILTFSHGAAFAARSFAAHQGFMNLLRRAYEERDATRFIHTLSDYLEQAQGRVAQVPHARDIPGILTEVERITQQAGFPLVARRLLSAQQLQVQPVR